LLYSSLLVLVRVEMVGIGVCAGHCGSREQAPGKRETVPVLHVCARRNYPVSVRTVHFTDDLRAVCGNALLVQPTNAPGVAIIASSPLVCCRLTQPIELATAAALSCYVLGCLLFFNLGPLSVIIQYLFMLPTFINSFAIFSFCNMHDISWGTKEGNSANQAVFVQKRPNEAELMKFASDDVKKKLAEEEAKAKAEQEKRRTAVRCRVFLFASRWWPRARFIGVCGALCAADDRAEQTRHGVLPVPCAFVAVLVHLQLRTRLGCVVLWIPVCVRFCGGWYHLFHDGHAYRRYVCCRRNVKLWKFPGCLPLRLCLVVVVVSGAILYQLERVFKSVWSLLCGDSIGCFWHRRRDIFLNPAKDNESVAFDDSDYYSSSDEDEPLVEDEQVPATGSVREADRQEWLQRMLEWAPDRDEDRVVYGLPPRENGEYHVRRCRGQKPRLALCQDDT
jgi:hypothetical protein